MVYKLPDYRKLNKKRRYQIYCSRRVSVIVFIMYAYSQNIGKLNNLKSLEARKLKSFKTIAKIG
jgi:hypothetical protein